MDLVLNKSQYLGSTDSIHPESSLEEFNYLISAGSSQRAHTFCPIALFRRASANSDDSSGTVGLLVLCGAKGLCPRAQARLS